jgi:hypothetical protein
MTVRGGYLVASLLLIAAYPLLPTAGSDTVVVLASLGAIPAVVVGLRRFSPGRRRPWVLLLAALAVISAAHVAASFPVALLAASAASSTPRATSWG